MTPKERFVEIDNRRKKLGISQSILCKEAGTSLSAYRFVLSGDTKNSKKCDPSVFESILDRCEKYGTGVLSSTTDWIPQFEEFERRRKIIEVDQTYICKLLGITRKTYHRTGKGFSMGSKCDPKKVDKLLTKLESCASRIRKMGIESRKVEELEKKKRQDREKELKKRTQERARKMEDMSVGNTTVFGRCLMVEMVHSGMVRETLACPGKLETDSQCLLREKCKQCPYLKR